MLHYHIVNKRYVDNDKDKSHYLFHADSLRAISDEVKMLFDNDVFNFSHYKKSIFENDVDPDDNYYDMNTKCNYFTN